MFHDNWRGIFKAMDFPEQGYALHSQKVIYAAGDHFMAMMDALEEW